MLLYLPPAAHMITSDLDWSSSKDNTSAIICYYKWTKSALSCLVIMQDVAHPWVQF